MSAPTQQGSFLSTPRGRLTLVFLCLVGFLDFADGSIVNVSLPSIQHDLHVSIQNLQWVLSGYVLTYGGFLLLGGRLSDLLGRRRFLLAGTILFAVSSLLSGFAQDAGTLIAGRLLQGLGAAMMTPAALSILTTTFHQGTDRLKALGAWGAVGGLASLLGVFLGGVITGGPGWRWVFFVNPPVCVIIVIAAYRLLDDDRRRAKPAQFDIPGAVLITASMLSLIYALVRAPVIGWGNGETLAGLVLAAVLLIAFVINENRQAHPLVPFSIFRVKGLAAADATQVIAFAGFGSMFFFVTLYMQDVLGFSPTRAGLSYVPAGVAVVLGAGVSSRLFARVGTRPLIVAGALLAAGGVFWLAQIPVHGTYPGDLLPGLMIMGLGLGAVLVGVQTAGNAAVRPDQAGLAAALVNAAFQLGVALGLAIFSAIATARTTELLARHVAPPVALTSGFHRALLASAIFLVAAAVIATRAANTKGEPAAGETPSAAGDTGPVSVPQPSGAGTGDDPARLTI
jgi:EmrB/QacA subfamily drug resistance transporter